MSKRPDDLEPLRLILHRALVRYLTLRPKGFLLEEGKPPVPTIQARLLAYGGARTLYRDRRPTCRSLDGVHSVTHQGRGCAPCEMRHACTPQVRLDLVVEGMAYRLLLAHTSARQFLAYDAELRDRKIQFDKTLHRLEVVDRGSWGEVRFSKVD